MHLFPKQKTSRRITYEVIVWTQYRPYWVQDLDFKYKLKIAFQIKNVLYLYNTLSVLHYQTLDSKAFSIYFGTVLYQIIKSVNCVEGEI